MRHRALALVLLGAALLLALFLALRGSRVPRVPGARDQGERVASSAAERFEAPPTPRLPIRSGAPEGRPAVEAAAQAGGSVYGRVTDSAGQPVPQAAVS